MGIFTYQPRNVDSADVTQLVNDALERVLLDEHPFEVIGASNRVMRECLTALDQEHVSRCRIVTKSGAGYKCHVVSYIPSWYLPLYTSYGKRSYTGHFPLEWYLTDYVFDVEDENKLLMLKLMMS